MIADQFVFCEREMCEDLRDRRKGLPTAQGGRSATNSAASWAKTAVKKSTALRIIEEDLMVSERKRL